MSNMATATSHRKSAGGNAVPGSRLAANGGDIMDIYDGRACEGIRILDMRHAQVAAHAR